jgi:hypothetical protein
MSQSGQEGVQGTGTDGEPNGQQGTGTDGAQGTGNGGNGTGADSAQQNSGQDTGSNTVSQVDFDKLKNQLSAADKAREEAQKALKQLQDKDLSELEKAKGDLQTITGERDTLAATVNELRLANAFLSANTITWQNADVALRIAADQGYLEGVQDDKGSVDTKAMATALKKLSEEHKYLVKAGDDSEEEEGKPGPSGAPASRAGKGNATDDKARADRLKQTLPALGRR